MPHFNSELFRQEVINIVGQIPRGRVLTYGQIARLAGYPLLSDEAIPCHRVVNSAGRLAPNWPEQRQLLESEGVLFKPNGNVGLKQAQWEITAFSEP